MAETGSDGADDAGGQQNGKGPDGDRVPPSLWSSLPASNDDGQPKRVSDGEAPPFDAAPPPAPPEMQRVEIPRTVKWSENERVAAMAAFEALEAAKRNTRGAGGEAPPPPPPQAPPPQAPPPQAPQPSPDDENGPPAINVKDIELAPGEIAAKCWPKRAPRENCVIVAMVGLAGTGKSFTVKRLRETLGLNYNFTTINGKSFQFPTEGRLTRTEQICGYMICPDNDKKNKKSFLILDIPGERLESLQKFTTGDGESGKSIFTGRVADMGAALAIADVAVFVIPAQQALDRRGYLSRETGDAEGRSAKERRRRIEELDLFIGNLNMLRNFVLPLRAAARTAANAEQLMAAINARLATIQSTQSIQRQWGRLDLPALVLLSRADEYRAILPATEPADFDRDPVAHIARQRPELIAKFASQFDRCKWDFVTPYENCRPENADSSLSHHGVANLAAWFEDMATTARRPWWQPPFMASADDALAAKATRDPLLAQALGQGGNN